MPPSVVRLDRRYRTAARTAVSNITGNGFNSVIPGGPLGAQRMTRIGIFYTNHDTGQEAPIWGRFDAVGQTAGWGVIGGRYHGTVAFIDGGGGTNVLTMVRSVSPRCAFLVGMTLQEPGVIGANFKAFMNGVKLSQSATPAGYTSPVAFPFFLSSVNTAARAQTWTCGILGIDGTAITETDMQNYCNVLIDDLEQGRTTITKTTPAGVTMSFCYDARDAFRDIVAGWPDQQNNNPNIFTNPTISPMPMPASVPMQFERTR